MHMCSLIWHPRAKKIVALVELAFFKRKQNKRLSTMGHCNPDPSPRKPEQLLCLGLDKLLVQPEQRWLVCLFEHSGLWNTNSYQVLLQLHEIELGQFIIDC